MKKIIFLGIIAVTIAVVEWQKREIAAQTEAWLAAGADD